MEKNYTTPEDFAIDPSFFRYCFHEDEADIQYWEQWIKHHPDQQNNIEQALQLLTALSIKTSHGHKHKEWGKLKKQIAVKANNQSGKRLSAKRRNPLWWIAAAVLLALLSTIGLTLLVNSKTTAQLVYKTETGENKQITLPDKTKVWLNADSRLICQKNFEHADKRIVTLIGEGFFNVRKEAGRPFIIHANALDIEVLGTTFNVRAYPHSATTSTTLISGAIRVSLAGQPDSVYRLQPKEKLTIENNKNKQAEKNTPSQKQIKTLPKISPLKPVFKVSRVTKDPLLDNDEFIETAWKNGKLAFKNESFAELALQLSHRYGLQFHFEARELKNYRFTGIFTNERIAEVLHALQLTSPSRPFTYKIVGNEVYITKNKNHHKNFNN